MFYNQKGITKIEIASIIFVLLTLVGLAYYSIVSAQKRARDEERVRNVHHIYETLLKYVVEEKKMPTNINGEKLVCDDESGFLKELLDKGLLDSIPKDKNSEEFKYCYYDYGAGSNVGAVVGIQMESTNIEPVCFLDNDKIDWCDETYYCLCQPYKLEQIPVK